MTFRVKCFPRYITTLALIQLVLYLYDPMRIHWFQKSRENQHIKVWFQSRWFGPSDITPQLKCFLTEWKKNPKNYKIKRKPVNLLPTAKHLLMSISANFTFCHRNSSSQLRYVVVVTSRVKSFYHRMLIRSNWGNFSQLDEPGKFYAHVLISILLLKRMNNLQSMFIRGK